MTINQWGSRARQRGLSFIGLVLIGVAAVAVFAIGGQSVPMFIEFNAAKRAIEKAKLAGSVTEIRAQFDRSAAIDDINSIRGADLEISKAGDKVIVKFKYSREIALAGPAFLVYRFEAQTK